MSALVTIYDILATFDLGQFPRLPFVTVAAATTILLYLVIRTVYRLFFHPLRRIPGPKLTAATHAVEFYYDVIKGGKFIWEVERMHKVYGPIVRVNPRQVHISDPDFYDEIYTGSQRRRDKDHTFPVRYAASLSVISTVPHDLHRVRRGLLNQFFSKRSVTRLEPIIHEKTEKLVERFREAMENDTILKLEYTYAALTSDVISHYCYGTSYRYLDDFFPTNDLKDAFDHLFLNIHNLYFFPWLLTLMNALPPWLMEKINPNSGPMAYFRDKLRKQSAEALRAEGARDKRANIFDALVDPSVPVTERTIERLTEEGMIVLGAGAETTANTMVLCTYHLIKNPDVLKKLRDELKQLMPHPTSSAPWAQAEQLPYLTAVINETLRLAIGGSWRLPRVPTDEDLMYKNHVIPRGTPVSTASYFVHMNEDIFPNPKKFDPERWIRATERGERLTQYITSFTKGSRQCVGINMAYAELYVVVARIARQFNLELVDTTDEDVAFARDYAVPYAEKGPWSVRVRVIGEETE